MKRIVLLLTILVSTQALATPNTRVSGVYTGGASYAKYCETVCDNHVAKCTKRERELAHKYTEECLNILEREYGAQDKRYSTDKSGD